MNSNNSDKSNLSYAYNSVSYKKVHMISNYVSYSIVLCFSVKKVGIYVQQFS